MLHAALPPPLGLGADRVAFLLPTRCARQAFRRAVLARLAGDNHHGEGDDEDDNEDEEGEDEDGGGWSVEVREAPEKHFDFRGRKVPVPSVIWTLTKRR